MSDEIGRQPAKPKHILIPTVVLGVVAVAILILVGRSSGDDSKLRVVFADQEAGAIFTADLEGNDRQRIAEGENVGYLEVFGDGRYVAYGQLGSEYREGYSRVAAIDGSGEQDLGPDEGIAFGARSSPEFVVGRWKEPSGDSVFLGRGDDGELRLLTAGTPRAISDDGKTVLVERFSDKLDENVMFAVDTGSGEEIRLGEGNSLALSSDGSKVLYVGSGDKTFIADTTIPGSGSPVGPADVSSRLSPDGKQIAYVTFATEPERAFLLDIESGERSRLGAAEATEFMPDGKSILLTVPPGPPYEDETFVNRVEIDSGEGSEVAKGSHPVSSPDGRYLVTSRTVDAGGAVDWDPHLTDLETGESFRLAKGILMDGNNTAADFYEVP